MKARIDLRILIHAPLESVWQVLADFEEQRRWMVDVRSLEVVSEQTSGAGTVVRVTSELFGLPLVKDVMEVDAWEPPRRYSVVHRGQFSGRGAFELEPANGGTIFRWWEEFQPPLGRLGGLAFRFVVGPHLQGVFSRSMLNVKQLAEAKAAEAA